MKLIKSLVILSLIFISSCVRINREKSEIKAKTKDDGKGSWETNYECPGIQISSDNGKNWSLKERVTFSATQIEKPKDNETLGIYFTFLKPISDKLKKILIADTKPNTFYLPYRHITSRFSYTNPFFNFKTLQGLILNDKKENISFKINLPYSTLSWFINDEQGNKLCELIQKNRNKIVSLVSSEKLKTVTSGSKLINGKSLANLANAEGDSIAQQKKLLDDNIVKMNGEMEKSKKTISELSIEISKLEGELNMKKDIFNKENTHMSVMSAEISEMKKKYAMLEDKSTEASAKKAEIDKSNDIFSTEFTSGISKLNEVTPDKKEDIKVASDSVLVKLSKPDLETSIAKIYP